MDFFTDFTTNSLFLILGSAAIWIILYLVLVWHFIMSAVRAGVKEAVTEVLNNFQKQSINQKEKDE